MGAVIGVFWDASKYADGFQDWFTLVFRLTLISISAAFETWATFIRLVYQFGFRWTALFSILDVATFFFPEWMQPKLCRDNIVKFRALEVTLLVVSGMLAGIVYAPLVAQVGVFYAAPVYFVSWQTFKVLMQYGMTQFIMTCS